MRHINQTHNHLQLIHSLCSGHEYISLPFHLLVFYQQHFAKSKTKKHQEWL
jgi:hypothetical protein